MPAFFYAPFYLFTMYICVYSNGIGFVYSYSLFPYRPTLSFSRPQAKSLMRYHSAIAVLWMLYELDLPLVFMYNAPPPPSPGKGHSCSLLYKFRQRNGSLCHMTFIVLVLYTDDNVLFFLILFFNYASERRS